MTGQKTDEETDEGFHISFLTQFFFKENLKGQQGRDLK